MVDRLRGGASRPRAAGRAATRPDGAPRRPERRPGSQPGAVWSDLPLFPESGAPEPIVRGGRPKGSRPLAVRRGTPVRRRIRDDRPAAPADAGGAAARLGVDGAAVEEAAMAAGMPPAPPVRRLAAGVADALLLGAVDGVVVALTARLLGVPLGLASAADLPWLPLAAYLALFDLASVVTLTALGGQTLGKMAAGVRVVGRDGEAVSISQALARSLLSVLSLMPAGLGFVGLLRRSRRAGHDWLAGTRVVAVARA